MRTLLPRVLLGATLVVAGCGSNEPEVVKAVAPARDTLTATTMPTTTTTTINHLKVGLEYAVNVLEYVVAKERVNVDEGDVKPPSTATAQSEAGVVVPSPAPASDAPLDDPLQPCGGDLPPCWVAKRESGGRYDAVNWGGCGGRNCYGKWQFSGAWACKLGLPCDLLTATPEQQDAAARELWAGGRGCSNWAAC